MKRAVALILVAVGLLGGCGRKDSTPEGTVKAFLAAVASLEADKAYELLAPVTREELRALAEKASRHTGGRQQLKPEEMILLGLVRPAANVSETRVVAQTAGEARVHLISDGKEPVTEELKLVNDNGAWRVVLVLPKAQ